MASISTLVVAVRTTGQAGLGRLATGFATVRVAANRLTNRFVASGGLVGASQRLGTRVQTLGRGLMGLARGAFRSAAQAAGHLGSSLADAAKAAAPMVAKIALIAALALPAVHALADLSGAVALLAPALVGAAASMVTLKLGLSGVSDAISAGLSGDMEAYTKALGKLTPAAREFAASAVEIAKQWRPVKAAVQEQLFGAGNLAHKLRQLSIVFKPLAEKWLPMIAAEFSRAGAKAADFLMRPENVQKVNDILGSTVATLRNLLSIAGSFGRVFLAVADKAAPRLTIVSEALAKIADRFADWVDKAAASGGLGAWIDKALAGFRGIWGILKEVGGIIGAVFKAGDGQGASFLETIRKLVAKWREFAESPAGQTIIKVIGAIGIAIFTLAAQIPTALLKIQDAFIALAPVVLRVLGTIVHAAANALGWMPGIGPKLKQAAKDFDTFAAQVNAALDRIRNKDIVIRYRVIGGMGMTAAQQSGTYSSGIGGRASGGPVTAGTPYIVGEKRPELFVPNRSGRILPSVPRGGGAMQVELVVAPGANGLFAAAIQQAARGGLLKLRVTAAGNVTA